MRLNTQVEEGLPDNIERTSYARDRSCSIVHIGTGAFHKAHQAVYFDQLMDAGESNWMIHGASLRRTVAADQLNPQDGLFTLTIRDGVHTRHQIVRSVLGVIDATSTPNRLIEALANPKTVLVTLTITEKGYYMDPSSGELNKNDPAITSDFRDLSAPKTALGYLVAGLAHRRNLGTKPFTVLSCDNIPLNGQRVRSAVLQLARNVDTSLSDWIEEEVAFPSSMVDRIVPATTSADITELESNLGFRDEALVNTEPFSQWVIEDKFCNERPPLNKVGVQFTTNVEPFEKVKLRFLNAAHSTLAYLGSLAGYRYVHEAVADKCFSLLIDKVWDEAEVTLDSIKNFDFSDYRSELKTRFANTALQHRTEQIAIDGSQKIRQRLLNSVIDRRNLGLCSPAIALSVAGWIRWLFGKDESGREYEVIDPFADQLREIVDTVRAEPSSLVRSMIAFEPIFGTEFGGDSNFELDLRIALSEIFEHGIVTTVKRFVQPQD